MLGIVVATPVLARTQASAAWWGLNPPGGDAYPPAWVFIAMTPIPDSATARIVFESPWLNPRAPATVAATPASERKLYATSTVL
jgi:hypothetical protein